MKTKRNDNFEQNKDSLANAATYVKNLLVSGPDGATGKGLELGVGAILAKTVLKRLPVPFNYVVPFVAEKIIMKHGVESGREVLLSGLRWVKKVTDEKPSVKLPKTF